MQGLIDSAAIYSRHAGTGLFSTLVTSGIACRLALIKSGRSVEDRAALAAMRNFLWDPAVTINEKHQVEVNGERWSFIPGTMQAARGPNGSVHHRRADVVKVA